MSTLPFSEAAERNKAPILAALRPWLGRDATRVLEVGSGTGQHAAFFARELPDISWQPTDRPDYLPGLHARIAASELPNLAAPFELDVDAPPADVPPVDVIYTANTLHIMAWPSVVRCFALVGGWLAPGGRLVVYGPFHVGGRATSKSNARFDQSLRSRGVGMGVRGREAVCRQADAVGFSLVSVTPMPANNQLLVFERRAI
ncbi:MAG: DUF938 domain-containing protein [Pseudomonadota bacterium]